MNRRKKYLNLKGLYIVKQKLKILKRKKYEQETKKEIS